MFAVGFVARKDPENPGDPYGRHFPIAFEEDNGHSPTGPITHRETREEALLLADALSKVLTMDATALEKLLGK